MCMKNVNISTVFCNQDLSKIGGFVRLGDFIDEIQVEQTAPNKYMIDKLTIVTFASAISGSNDIDLTKEYDILWLFESINGEEQERIQLAANTYDVKNNKVDMQAMEVCRSFSNQIFKFTLRHFIIRNFDCVYLLKTFMREKGKTTFEIQSINSIKIVKN